MSGFGPGPAATFSMGLERGAGFQEAPGLIQLLRGLEEKASGRVSVGPAEELHGPWPHTAGLGGSGSAAWSEHPGPPFGTPRTHIWDAHNPPAGEQPCAGGCAGTWSWGSSSGQQLLLPTRTHGSKAGQDPWTPLATAGHVELWERGLLAGLGCTVTSLAALASLGPWPAVCGGAGAG